MSWLDKRSSPGTAGSRAVGGLARGGLLLMLITAPTWSAAWALDGSATGLTAVGMLLGAWLSVANGSD